VSNTSRTNSAQSFPDASAARAIDQIAASIIDASVITVVYVGVG